VIILKTRGSFEENTQAIDFTRIRAFVVRGAMSADHLILLDCCYAGAATIRAVGVPKHSIDYIAAANLASTPTRCLSFTRMLTIAFEKLRDETFSVYGPGDPSLWQTLVELQETREKDEPFHRDRQAHGLKFGQDSNWSKRSDKKIAKDEERKRKDRENKEKELDQEQLERKGSHKKYMHYPLLPTDHDPKMPRPCIRKLRSGGC
jgi:hypothetical protein